MRTSQQTARSNPPAIAGPLTAAISGNGNCSSVRVVAVRRRPQRTVEGGVGGGGLELLQIEPRAKDGALAGDDHDRDGVVVGQRVEGVAHGVAQGDRQRVAPLRAA